MRQGLRWQQYTPGMSTRPTSLHTQAHTEKNTHTRTHIYGHPHWKIRLHTKQTEIAFTRLFRAYRYFCLSPCKYECVWLSVSLAPCARLAGCVYPSNYVCVCMQGMRKCQYFLVPARDLNITCSKSRTFSNFNSAFNECTNVPKDTAEPHWRHPASSALPSTQSTAWTAAL